MTTEITGNITSTVITYTADVVLKTFDIVHNITAYVNVNFTAIKIALGLETLDGAVTAILVNSQETRDGLTTFNLTITLQV